MKGRYLIFRGEGYYPQGGGRDFINAYDNIDKAMNYLKRCPTSEWCHIFDLEKQEVIKDLLSRGWVDE